MRSPIYAVQSHTGRRTPARHGFTLLELLVVIALTAIIIVLVFRPLIDSFNLTSRAGTQIESQTAAREIMREVSTTLSNAEYIYDNTRPNSKINIWYYDNGGQASFKALQFGLVDYVAPGHQADQNTSAGGPIDPTTGEPILDPTQPVGKQGYSLPLAPGRVIERMFIGLRDNRSAADTHIVDALWPNDATQSGMPVDSQGNYHGYANRWSDPHQQGASGNDNRYTLFKAQFLAYIPDPSAADPKHPNYIPNLSLFHTGTNASDPTSKTDMKTDQIILNDPNFFYDNGLAGDATSKGNQKWAVPGWKDLVGDGKVYYWENWRAVATSMLQLPKADTIALARDDKSNVLYFYYNSKTQALEPPLPGIRGYPTPRTLISFAPSYIENEAANPVNTDSSGAEVSYVAASTFIGQHAAWSTPFRVLAYQNNVPGDPTTVNALSDPLSQNPKTFYQYYINPVTMVSKIVYSEVPNGSNSPDPAAGTDVGPMLDANGFFTNMNPQYAFTVDTQRGVINFAFPHWAYMHSASGVHLPQQYYSGDVNNGYFTTITYQDPNANPPNQTRTISKRFLLLDDTFPGPADQAAVANPPAVSPLKQLFLNPKTNDPATKPQRVRIVPGSEVVYGPDQRPGPHYGWSIQYTRVSANAGAVGPNQYKINYEPISNPTSVASTDEPVSRTGYIEFDSIPDSSAAVNNPALDSKGNLTEDPDHNQYRPHSLPLARAGSFASGGPLPGGYQSADPILVTYKFQMNRPGDVVKIDYLTRELMSVSINSRLYDPATTGAQDTLLTSQVKARNLQR